MDKLCVPNPEFIDVTILNTPKPQASSTVERKGVYSYRTDKTSADNCDYQNTKSNPSKNYVQMDIPTRDIDTQSNISHSSSVSSLGILSMNNIEDIKEILLSNDSSHSNRKSSINETLARQRLLAQKAMEKVDGKVKGNVGELPSYLLKPVQTGNNNTTHTPYKNESTINLSDLENSAQLKSNNELNRVSFDMQEISARSSSLGNQKDELQFQELTSTIDLRTPSPVRGLSSDFAARYQNIYEQLRQSDASLAAICDRSSQMGMRTQPLGNLQLPDIDTIDLSSTCESWMNAQQDSLVAKLQNELFTPAELAENKLLADEISWCQARDILSTQMQNPNANSYIDVSGFSGYIGDANISLRSKVNEKVSISEFFKRNTVEIEDLSFKTSPEKRNEPVPLIDLTNSIILDERTSETKPIESQNRMSSNSMISMSHIADILSKMNIQETPSKALNLLLNKKSTPTSLFNDESTLKNTPALKIYSPGSDSTLKENSSPKFDMKTFKKDVINISDSSNLSDNEWMDANTKILGPSDNATVSSIVESPSYSCSELEFSDDERSSSAEEFIHIDTMKSYKIYVDMSQNIPITLHSKTNHWLHVKMLIKDVNYTTGNNVKIDVLNKDGVLNPFATEQFLVNVTSSTCDNINIVLQIEVENIVTKVKKVLEHILIIDVEVSKVKLLNEILDFKLIPEGAMKRLTVSFHNESTTSVTLSLNIQQKYKWVFVFGSEIPCNYNDTKIETTILVAIPASKMVSVPVDMRGLALEDLGVAPGVELADVLGCIQVQNVNSNKILHEVQLRGSVGFTKVQFKTSCMPFVLSPGQTKPMQVRNSGVVPLELSVSVSLPDFDTIIEKCSDNIFIVDRNSLVLQPGQIGTVNITFNPEDKYKTIKRVIRLDYPNGPNFVLPIEGVIDSKSSSPVVTVSPRRPGSNSSGSSYSSTGSLHSLPDGKLPIQSTRTQLVWGCVRPGRPTSQDFVLRNCHSQRVRLQAVIQGSQTFKFVKDLNENTGMNIMLHARESRTISVSFNPSNKGAVAARLMFLPIDHEISNSKRQMIQLYGYGGYVAVDVQKVAKDTSGRMWLSFGPLDYRDTLNQTFVLRNTGSLTAFAYLSISCKVLYPFMDSSVTIYPTEAIIEPNKEVEISVNFTPRPEDFKYIQKSAALEVSEIASIKIMTGPEATRGRIRRLFNKITSTNTTNIITELTSTFLLPRLSASWPGEHIPSDITSCRESSHALRDLLRDVDSRDLVLTVEHSSGDCTTMAGAFDNTLLFQSLAIGDADNTLMSTTGRASGGFCSVEPKILTMSVNERKVVMVRSHHSRKMPYEVCVPQNAGEVGLVASPLVGLLSPGEGANVVVVCTKQPTRVPYTCLIMIYVENEVMEVEIKIPTLAR